MVDTEGAIVVVASDGGGANEVNGVGEVVDELVVVASLDPVQAEASTANTTSGRSRLAIGGEDIWCGGNQPSMWTTSKVSSSSWVPMRMRDPSGIVPSRIRIAIGSAIPVCIKRLSGLAPKAGS